MMMDVVDDDDDDDDRDYDIDEGAVETTILMIIKMI